MKQKGFTLIGLLVTISIIGIVVAVVVSNIGLFLKAGKDAANETIFEELEVRPISTLNLTELEFMVDYCSNSSSEAWLVRAAVYQNQILINEIRELGIGELELANK